MDIILTQFAIDRHFDPQKVGTIITDRSPEVFQQQARQLATQPNTVCDGYAPFCKLMFLENWTDTRSGTTEINSRNESFLKSEYVSRTPGELPVLTRWLELGNAPLAKYLCLVLYNKEQLAKEGTDIDADWGVVAILGQLHDEEEPMTPITMMRNALGVDEGGSGKSLDREAYKKSVEFWNTHATIKVIR